MMMRRRNRIQVGARVSRFTLSDSAESGHMVSDDQFRLVMQLGAERRLPPLYQARYDKMYGDSGQQKK